MIDNDYSEFFGFINDKKDEYSDDVLILTVLNEITDLYN